MSDEVKIVVNFKDDVAMVGVGKPDCDPKLFRVEGKLPAVLKGILTQVKTAEDAWAKSPRYPKTDWKPPTPPTPPAPARQPVRSRQTEQQQLI
jgi:hypothetical protein